MFSLDGRTALVTGAGRGVGAGIARALAEQGALVVVNDLFAERAENTAKEIGGRARACAFDVTEAADPGVARLLPLHPKQPPSSRRISPKG